MRIARRVEQQARAVARVTRGLASARGRGTRVGYARVLDGEHLWVAVPVGDGRPALLDPATGELLPQTDTPVHEDGDGHACGRWRLADLVPEHDDAELQLVVVGEGGPTPVRPEAEVPSSSLRVPATPDGHWRFLVVTDGAGHVRVRRTRARGAQLLGVRAVGGGAVLTIGRPPGTDEPTLLLLRRDDSVAARLPVTVEADGLVATVSALDAPGTGTFRVALGSSAGTIPVVRRPNDLYVATPTDVLLPALIDPETTELLGRLAFAREGALRLVRRDPEEATA